MVAHMIFAWTRVTTEMLIIASFRQDAISPRSDATGAARPALSVKHEELDT
jgi:hypothetical protein